MVIDREFPFLPSGVEAANSTAVVFPTVIVLGSTFDLLGNKPEDSFHFTMESLDDATELKACCMLMHSQ